MLGAYHSLHSLLIFVLFNLFQASYSLKPQYLDVSFDTTASSFLQNTCGKTIENIEHLLSIGAVSFRDTREAKIQWKKLTAKQYVNQHTQIRLYDPPQRFPSGNCDWEERLLVCKDEYLIVNKPAGLPCMAHPSNSYEHLTACVKR